MTYYYIDLLLKCVIAELTDATQAQELIQNLGPRFGVLETSAAFNAKDMAVPTGAEPAGRMDGLPDYGPLNVWGIAYTPFMVADVFTDYDLTVAEVHHDSNRYELVTDASGYVRDINRMSNVPPPKDFLRITTDAVDDNPPDGYPDIPADGTSACLIMIQKVNGQTGVNMTGAGDNELIQLTTTAGKLSAVQVSLVNGYAEVTLTSSPDTVITPVQASTPSGTLEAGTLLVQFA